MSNSRELINLILLYINFICLQSLSTHNYYFLEKNSVVWYTLFIVYGNLSLYTLLMICIALIVNNESIVTYRFGDSNFMLVLFNAIVLPSISYFIIIIKEKINFSKIKIFKIVYCVSIILFMYFMLFGTTNHLSYFLSSKIHKSNNFENEALHRLVVDNYNLQNKKKVSYYHNFNDDELKSINYLKVLYYWEDSLTINNLSNANIYFECEGIDTVNIDGVKGVTFDYL